MASFGTTQDKAVIDDIGRALARKWEFDNGILFLPDTNEEKKVLMRQNPWSLSCIKKIKEEFESKPEKAKQKYKELFYYFDGMVGTKVSQSVHPAGMVISPITLPDNFGVFDKDGDICLMLDMENIHDYTGLAKYDFLILKTVEIIRDACNYAGIPYPKSHEVDWDDQKVWEHMITDGAAVFQFSGQFAFDSLKKFKPKSIFDMSLVTAAIRPSGASYRDELLIRKIHKNPSKMIDDLLDDSLGLLVYQEQTIKFLQEICGLSGSEADNIRRAIGSFCRIL